MRNDVKKATLEDLIAKAEQSKKKKKERKDLYVKSLDSAITIEEPSRETCLEALDKGVSGDAFLVYNCIIAPNLKDSKLHKAYGVVSPIEIIDALMKPGEVSNIAKECVALAGYSDNVKPVEEIKN